MWNDMLTTACILKSGARLGQINKYFLPPGWKCSLNWSKRCNLQTKSREVVDIEGIVFLFIGIGDICARITLWRESHHSRTALNVVYWPRIHNIFPTEQKIVPLRLRPVTITVPKIVINYTNVDSTVLKVKTDSHWAAICHKMNVCQIACKITLHIYMPVALLVTSTGFVLMAIETPLPTLLNVCVLWMLKA